VLIGTIHQETRMIILTHFLDSNLYIGALREDTQKHIYFFADTASAEMLLYDFHLYVGDTLPPAPNPIMGANVIVSIDSILGTGHYHKRYNLGALENGSPFNLRSYH
jgi:hypothetical protein